MKRIILDEKESNYIITKEGKVFNTKTNKELKGSITENGYRYFRLSNCGKKYRYYAHRLVAEYFLPVEDKLDVVNHKNGNKLDNRVENLEWVTYSQNNLHANQLGLRKSNTKTKKYFKIEDNLPGEEWKIILDFPKYLVSNKGRVRSLQNNSDLLLKPVLTNGYLKVRLTNNIEVKDKLVAYLVYFTFNPQEELKNNYVIDHIDGNKTNNELSNLRYISRSDNTQAAYYSQKTQSNIKKVKCYKDGEFIGVFPSCREAARILKLDFSAISKCCRGLYKHTGGYNFFYE
jgi:hypothetical protein